MNDFPPAASDFRRYCLRDPIPEIFEAARLLDEAVSAHLLGKFERTKELIRLADIKEISDWSESLWGPYGEYNKPINPLPVTAERQGKRRPYIRVGTKTDVLRRDGFHCRFCGIPVVHPETRKAIREFSDGSHRVYRDVLRWGQSNGDQHAAFQAMELHFDHIIPHSRGGRNDATNIVVACAPCNCGRANHLLEEFGLADPLAREPVQSGWDGLERFRMRSARPSQ